ncbi:MAG: FkbM family methyltransferase [Deltaproteobacteria bacterium]|nr:FkbM family methyltransferase [Deltaproteobacteria bacterium]
MQIKNGLQRLYRRCRGRWEAELALRRYKDFRPERYDFTGEDVALYVSERAALLPPVNVVGADDNHFLLGVGDIEFYWPKNIPTGDLPWLYHEVFDDWRENPSSYDHPQFDLTAACWVMDAGAFEGFYSLFALRKNFAGMLIAVEPFPAMEEALGLTLGKAARESKYKVVAKALGSRMGHCYINQDAVSNCSSYVAEASPKDAWQKVELTTIDNLVREYGVEGPGIVKIDIEGYEMEALRGARNTIESLKPKLAVAIYHDYMNARECARIIRSFRSDYHIEFRGMYAYFEPPRPYLLFAY